MSTNAVTPLTKPAEVLIVWHLSGTRRLGREKGNEGGKINKERVKMDRRDWERRRSADTFKHGGHFPHGDGALSVELSQTQLHEEDWHGAKDQDGEVGHKERS